MLIASTLLCLFSVTFLTQGVPTNYRKEPHIHRLGERDLPTTIELDGRVFHRPLDTRDVQVSGVKGIPSYAQGPYLDDVDALPDNKTASLEARNPFRGPKVRWPGHNGPLGECHDLNRATDYWYLIGVRLACDLWFKLQGAKDPINRVEVTKSNPFLSSINLTSYSTHNNLLYVFEIHSSVAGDGTNPTPDASAQDIKYDTCIDTFGGFLTRGTLGTNFCHVKDTNPIVSLYMGGHYTEKIEPEDGSMTWNTRRQLW